jgi:putative heme-binding domain-containing protein
LSRQDLFALLLKLLADGTIEEQLTATQLLSSSSVTTEQLQRIAPLLADAGPGQLTDLVPLFRRPLKSDLAIAFLDNIENARSLRSLPTIIVSDVVKSFHQELHDRANTLLDRMHAAEQQKLLKLDSLIGKLKTGDAVRGKAVFFSEKTKCATCHVVGKNDDGELLGKRVGPDLTTIGASRTAKDLLESIIFPSSTIVRQDEPYTLLTVNGRTYSGLVLNDTSEELSIQQTTGDPVTVASDEIEELIPGTVSVMPKGLDEELSG